MKKIREEDLILYLYKECSPAMAAIIDEALKEDIGLQERLQTLRRSIRQLDKLKTIPPSKLSVKTILSYAKEAGKRKD